MRISKCFKACGPLFVAGVGIGVMASAQAETQTGSTYQGRPVITLDDAPSTRPSPSPLPRTQTSTVPRVATTSVPRAVTPGAPVVRTAPSAASTNFRTAPVATPTSSLGFPAQPVQRPVQRPIQQPFQRPVQRPVQQPFRTAQRPAPRPTPTATAKSTSREEAVDLNQLDSTTPGAGGNPHAAKGNSNTAGDPFGGLNLAPNFKFFFDLWLINQPNVMDLTFKNVHSYTFIDLMPDKKLTFAFSFNLSSRSNYFELGYQVTPRLQLRGGKILIPFDDTFPHTMYGGRPNLSVFFMENQTAFLPDLWAEPGIAAKYRIYEQSGFHMDGTLYVTNGFQAGTSDPLPGQSGGVYPDFNGISTIDLSDNNRDKAIGGRLETLWARKFGLNGSFYTCRYSNQGDEADRLTALGIDSQLRFASSGTEFRAALMSMKVDLPYDSFTRSGWYLEASKKFGLKRDWKAIVRTGYRQNDNRVIEVGDQRLLGGILVWKPGLVQWSFETWRDLNDVPGKVNYTLTALRAAVEL